MSHTDRDSSYSFSRNSSLCFSLPDKYSDFLTYIQMLNINSKWVQLHKYQCLNHLSEQFSAAWIYLVGYSNHTDYPK